LEPLSYPWFFIEGLSVTKFLSSGTPSSRPHELSLLATFPLFPPPTPTRSCPLRYWFLLGSPSGSLRRALPLFFPGLPRVLENVKTPPARGEPQVFKMQPSFPFASQFTCLQPPPRKPAFFLYCGRPWAYPPCQLLKFSCPSRQVREFSSPPPFAIRRRAFHGLGLITVPIFLCVTWHP